jgi:ATP-binding cassette subfamily B (MDR/TAP) protein 1
VENYDKYLEEARSTGVKTHLKTSFITGLFYLLILGLNPYAYYIASWFITEQVYNGNTGKDYTSGDIFICFFGVFIGMFSVGMATPNIKAVTEGRVAGKMAFELIERKPKLETNLSTKLEQVKGKIEFKNVTFSYPTKSD